MYPPVQKALVAVGNRSTYQVLLIVFLFLIAGEVNYMLMGPTFIFMNPLFNCSFSDQPVDESIACDRLSECQIANSFTIVAQVELYCDRQTERNVIQSISFIGSIFGLILVNYLSDTRGRKVAMIVVQLVCVVGVQLTFLGGWIKSIWILVVAQFLCGFSGSAMIIMALLLPSQFCEDEFRQKSLITINYAWSATSVLLGLLFYYYNIWYNYVVWIVLLPMIAIMIVSYFYLVEGPNFLYGKKRDRECLESLRVIAKYNGREKEFQRISADFKLDLQEEQKQAQSVTSVLKNPEYLKTMIILALTETGASLYYVGTNYALDQIGYDYGANMIATGSIELVAFIVLSLTITKIPRKNGLIGFYSCTIVFGLLFLIESIRNDKIVSFVIIGIIRFFSTMGYTLIVMMLTESFPMSVQATCAGIIEAIAQLGSFFGPVIITVCINMQIYPVIALSLIAMVVILLPLFFLKVRRPEMKMEESLLVQDSLVVGKAE